MQLVTPPVVHTSLDVSAPKVAALIVRIQGRDQSALGELYALFSARLRLYIRRIVRNDQSAEDVMHDVFLRIWRYAAGFDFQKVSRPEAWMFQIARNQAITEAIILSRSVSIDFSDDDENQGRHWMLQEHDDTNVMDKVLSKSASFERAIGSLPASYRQALFLKYERDLTHEQISEALGVPIGTVKTWLRRALLQLRKRLHVRIESVSFEEVEA